MPASLKDFESVFPQLVEELKQHCKDYNLPTNALEWFERSLLENTVGGKCNRGLSVIDTSAFLLSDPSVTTTQSKDFIPTATLGWMIELLQAFFLVSDDIVDKSKTRRGKPCWYMRPEIGLIAINDACMLESAIYLLLKKHFRQHKQYIEMVELFQEVCFQTELGQTCDLITAPEDDVDLSRFSMDKYVFIVRFKTAYYSFYLPVALALHYCQLATEKNLKQAMDILIPMGEYFQVQDDYLDCFADPEVLGKIGTDIQDNKCSWVVNQALKKCSPEQRQTLDDNYGQRGDEPEARCKEVFNQLNIEQDYKQYEEKIVGDIRRMISDVDESEGLKKEVFEEFLRKIYKRTK